MAYEQRMSLEIGNSYFGNPNVGNHGFAVVAVMKVAHLGRHVVVFVRESRNAYVSDHILVDLVALCLQELISVVCLDS